MNRDKTDNSLLNRRNKNFVSSHSSHGSDFNDMPVILDKLISCILDNGGKLFGGFVRDYIVPKFITKSKEILRESQILYGDLIEVVFSYLYCVYDNSSGTALKIPDLFFNDIDIIIPNKETMDNIVECIRKLSCGTIQYTIERTKVEIVEGKENNEFGYFFNKNNHLLKMYDKEGNDFTCFVDFITIDRDVYIPSVTEYGISINLGYEIYDQKEQKVSDRTKIFPVWDFSINLLSYSKVARRSDTSASSGTCLKSENSYKLKAEKGLIIKTKKGEYSDDFYVYSIRNEEFTLDDILNHILDRKLIPLNPNEIRAYYYGYRIRKFHKRKYKFEDKYLHPYI